MNLIKYTCHIFFTDISVAFRDYNAEIIVDAKILFRSAKITNDERFLRMCIDPVSSDYGLDVRQG